MAVGSSVIFLFLSFVVVPSGAQNGCGGNVTLNDTSGTIYSPNYPSSYYALASCSYYIVSGSVSNISLTITFMDLERSSNCVFDWIEIKCESHSAGARTRYCGTGTDIGPIVLSPCTRAVVQFHSDSSISGSGFVINYEIREIECNGNCTVASTPCPTGCTKYSGSAYCSCSMTATTTTTTAPACPYGCRREYTFYGSPYCNCRDGETTAAAATGGTERLWCSFGCYSTTSYYGYRYCYCPTTTSAPCNYPCYYTYRYDEYYTYRYMCYCPTTTTAPPSTGCNQTLRASYGAVTSPNYPSAYPKGMDCYQYIAFPQASSIHLTLHDLNVFVYYYERSCLYDYLEVRGCDGNSYIYCSPSSFPLGGLVVHCTESTVVTVLFHSYESSYSSSYRGFRMTYSANTASNCSGDANSFLSAGSSGVITSPNYPANFPINSECHNFLYTEDDSIAIRISLEQLSLESSSTCRRVFLKLTCVDDDSRDSQTLCGTGTTFVKQFDCRALEIWFQSNSTGVPLARRNFRLRYMAVQKNAVYEPPRPISGEDAGLSKTATLGIGLGVGVGGFFLIVLVVLVVVLVVIVHRQGAHGSGRRRRSEDLSVSCRNIGGSAAEENGFSDVRMLVA